MIKRFAFLFLSFFCPFGVYAQTHGKSIPIRNIYQFEKDLVNTGNFPGKSLALTFIFESKANALDFISLGGLLNYLIETREEHLQFLVADLSVGDDELHQAILLGIREHLGNFQRASIVLEKAKEQGTEKELLAELFDYPQSLIPLLNWLKNKNLANDYLLEGVRSEWFETVWQLITNKIAATLEGRVWYAEQIDRWTPLHTYWEKIIDKGLQRDEDQFLHSVKQAARMGSPFHQEILAERGAFQATHPLFPSSVYSMWDNFIWWCLTRPAQELSTIMRQALDSVDILETKEQKMLQEDDVAWRNSIESSLHVRTTKFAKCVRLAIQQNDDCLLAWSRAVGDRKGIVGKAYQAWNQSRFEDSMERASNFDLSEDTSSSLSEFRKIFDLFLNDSQGWKSAMNHLWVESIGPPNVLREILCKTLSTESRDLWNIIKLSIVFSEETSERIRAKLNRWIIQNEIPLHLLQADFLKADEVSLLQQLLSLWLDEEIPRATLNDLIHNGGFGSSILTMMLATEKKEEIRSVSFIRSWSKERQRNAFLKQCTDISWLRVVCEWIQSSSSLQQSWNMLVAKIGRSDTTSLQWWVETMIPHDKRMDLLFSLATELVEESSIFEQLLISPQEGISTFIQNMATKYSLDISPQ